MIDVGRDALNKDLDESIVAESADRDFQQRGVDAHGSGIIQLGLSGTVS
jgi:hypothetical protein